MIFVKQTATNIHINDVWALLSVFHKLLPKKKTIQQELKSNIHLILLSDQSNLKNNFYIQVLLILKSNLIDPPHWQVLDVSDCPWFESHSFLALSKCTALEELRLSNNRINDFVPYISLGTRFGFRALSVCFETITGERILVFTTLNQNSFGNKNQIILFLLAK